MNSPSKDIVDILLAATSAVGLTAFNTDAFVAIQPDSPSNCVVVYDTGGYDSETRYEYDRPTVQVRIRNVSYENGYAMAHRIKLCLHGLNGTVINGARYIQILMSGDIFSLGQDEKKRYEFTVNFNIHRTSDNT